MFILATAMALMAAAADPAQGTAVLENDILRLTFVVNTIEVLDKRNGMHWTQADTDGRSREWCRLKEVAPDRLHMTLVAELPAVRKDGTRDDVPFQIELALKPENSPQVTLKFIPGTHDEWREVLWPAAFRLSSPDACAVLPHAEGLLAPLRRDAAHFLDIGRSAVYDGYGLYCACLGLTDLSDGRGLLMLFDDPELAGFDMHPTEMDGRPIVVPRILWLASKFRFSQPFRMTLDFQDHGGYVAMAKTYAAHHADASPRRTLEEKKRDNPLLDRLVGAPFLWIKAEPAELARIAGEMHEDGTERAAIGVLYPYDAEKNPDGPEAKALREAVRTISESGYIVYRYDQYRDCFQPDPTASPYIQFNTDGYPQDCVRQENGELRHGWPPGYVLNPERGLALAHKHIPPDLARFPWQARFVDCVGTCPLWEGEDWSADHPLDAAGTRRAWADLLQYTASQGQLVGTEGAMDIFLQQLHWLETPMSLVRWTNTSLPLPGWEPVELKPDYRVSIGTGWRIPFYSLVHHAEVISTWRWEDGFNRLPQYWQDKNLWTVLYGNPPLFFIDTAHYGKYRSEIAQTFKYTCPWVRKVGWSDLVSHRFVTADRTVQESLFSTGDGVVVNFAPTPHTMNDGQVIPARNYATFIGTDNRIYNAPPVDGMEGVE